MGEKRNTCYVRTADLQALAENVTRLLTRDGRRCAERGAGRPSRLYEGLPRDPERVPFWEVLLLPGAPGWSFAVTAPAELLCAPGRDSRSPRLLELCTLLEADAFQVNVYDGVGMTVIECTAAGALRMSGFIPELGVATTFQGLPLEDARPELRLLEVPDDVRAAFDGNASVVHSLRMPEATRAAPHFPRSRASTRSRDCPGRTNRRRLP